MTNDFSLISKKNTYDCFWEKMFENRKVDFSCSCFCVLLFLHMLMRVDCLSVGEPCFHFCDQFSYVFSFTKNVYIIYSDFSVLIFEKSKKSNQGSRKISKSKNNLWKVQKWCVRSWAKISSELPMYFLSYKLFSIFGKSRFSSFWKFITFSKI